MWGQRYSPIGLDLGEHSVKLLQLERHKRRWRIRDLRHVSLPAEPAGDSLQRVKKAIRQGLAGSQFHGHHVLSCLRLPDVGTRHVRVPSLPEPELSEVLQREIRESAARSDEDLRVSPLPVTELIDRGNRKQEFLCCVARATVVREHITLLDELGLIPVAIDLETCAQIRAFEEQDQSDADGCLYLDIGHHCTRLTIVRDGRPVLMRTVRMGGAELTAALRDRLQLGDDPLPAVAFDDPEMAPLRARISSTLTEQMELVIARISDCLRYCATLFQGHTVGQLRLLGGAASLVGVAEHLEQRLKVPVRLADPFAAAGLDIVADAGLAPPACFATVLGLALRGTA